MQKMTVAYANRVLTGLRVEKGFWLGRESSASTYILAVNEAPAVPDYDYQQVAAKLAEIDSRICAIEHAINLSNATSTVTAGGRELTVDAAIIRRNQLNGRRRTLDKMRRQLPMMRLDRAADMPGSEPPGICTCEL